MLGFDLITFDPHVMDGRACIRGMRITVSLLVNLVGNGMTNDEIIDAYPYLVVTSFFPRSLGLVKLLVSSYLTALVPPFQ